MESASLSWLDEITIASSEVAISQTQSEEIEPLSTDPQSLMESASLSWLDEITIASSEVAISQTQKRGGVDNDRSRRAK